VKALYPFESHYLRLQSGHRIHYLDEGHGPPLLMLHGNPTWSFYYRNLVSGLRSHYRCIVPDHLGCGLSDKPQNWTYRIRAHADNVAELLMTLDPGPVTLVAHDWGGPIGYLAATSNPDRFARFVTFNTATTLLPLPRLLSMLQLPGLGSIVIRGLNGMVRAGLLSTALSQGAIAPDVRAGYLLPYDSWANRIALLRFVEEIPLTKRHPNRALLRELGALPAFGSGRPHLVVWGLRDPVFHRGYLSAWRQRFPDAEVHVFEDASHWVVEERWERIIPLMQEFLARTDR
jgi:haloalkane dehalogenase